METELATKIRNFFKKFPEKHFDKGEVIVQAGETPPGVMYLVEGNVNQYDISPTGATVVVNVFKPPAFFPMSWAMNKTPNNYFFEAATNVAFHLAPADEVVEFIKENPDILFNLLSRVYKGTDGMMRRMAHLMGGDAKTRLHFELLNASYRFGEQKEDGSVFVPIKESDLAKHSGLTRETINRHIRTLKEQGLIEVSHQGFVLHDPKRLETDLGNQL
jgi:CRP-like cAMP-binding protein